MNIQLSDHFNYKRLLKFVLPSVVMMIFSSIYGVVDGLFVSNFVGSNSFAAVNLIMPLLMAFSSIGFMIGTGGCAIVAKTMGEGDSERANQYFSMLVYVTIVGGIILSVIGFVFIRPIAEWMGASDVLIEDAVLYGRILLVANTAFMLQNSFQSFFVAAEKPKMGLKITIAAGVTNIILDFLFIAVFGWGVAGAAIATAISYVIGGVIPVIYFSRKNDSLLRLVKTKFNGKALLKSCTNGSSEMMSNLSMSIVNMLYNVQLMKIAAENGVAAYGVIMYVNFVFVSAFIGYSIGSAPIIGYHYGADNRDELKNLFKKSLVIVLIASVIMTLMAELLAMPFAKIFVGYDTELLEMTCRGFRIFSISFLFAGINIFGSAFFTALNNGAVSALISFLRTLVFQIAAVLLLPIWLGLDGIWLAIVVAEILAMVLTIVLFIMKKKQYHYI